nr:hypothetical protein [uncultured bacterium]
MERIHGLKGLAAERAEEFDRKPAAELAEYADELKALKDSLPDANEFSRSVSDSIVNSPEIATGSFDGIETGIAAGGSGSDPIMTGDPGLDQLIRAFSKMQKKLAAEEIQRAKTRWQIDPKQEQMVREISDTMSKLFTGLAVGKNLVHGRPGAMTPGEISQVRQMLQEQRRELDRELKAVATVVKQRERTEPLRELLEPKAKAVEAKPEPAPLSPHLVKFVDKNVVLKPAEDVRKLGSMMVLRPGWLSDKIADVRAEANFWCIKADEAQIERAVVESMHRLKVPPMQAFEAVLKDSSVSRGDAMHAAQVVSQGYTRAALKAEGRPEVNLDEEAQKRFQDLYKRAESGIDAELKAMREQSRKDAQAEQQRLDEQEEKKRLELLERQAAKRLESDRDHSPTLGR